MILVVKRILLVALENINSERNGGVLQKYGTLGFNTRVMQKVRNLGYNAGGLERFSPPDTKVVQGKSGQKEIIRDFLRRYYLPGDPLLISSGVSKDEKLLDFWIQNMKPEFTLMAVEPKSGMVKAMAYNSVVNRNSSAAIMESAADAIKDQKAYRVACFFADVTAKANLFNRFNIREFLECMFIATHPEARKQGLAKYLVLHSTALAQSGGFPLMRMVCTNTNTARIAQRLNMEMLPRRQILDYKDKHGKPWLSVAPPPPNQHLDTFFTRLCPGLCSRIPPPPPAKKKRKRFIFF